MDNNVLDEKRLIGDADADNFINAVFENPKQKIELRTWLAGFESNHDFDALPAFCEGTEFIKQANSLPTWANERLMKQGAEFFVANTESVMTLLGLLSLPYCYAAADGAMVLYFSERIRNDTAKRLYDTAAFVWDVLAPDAFAAGGKGFAAILKVRLTHAAARYYTLGSGRWNQQWGFPVNQEDMAGTNLAFSLMVIRGLRKFGLTISYEEQQAYLHLWNVIGYLSGLGVDMLPQNGKEANQLEAAIRERHFKPSEQGVALTASLTSYFYQVNTGEVFSNAEITQTMRYLLGGEVADILGLSTGNFPAAKIQLLRLKTTLRSFKGNEKPTIAYRQGYAQFRKNKPVS